jgi:hypothetical protein
MTTTCPLCHTAGPAMTDAEVTSGTGWECGRCGHRWDARRLATAEAYTAYAAERDQANAVVKK